MAGFLPSLAGKKVLVLAHAGADVDAAGAAGAIYFSLGKKARITLAAPEHMNLNAKALAKNLGIPISTAVPNPDGFDRLIIVDLNSRSMLGSAAEAVGSFKGRTLVIDHHAPSRERLAKHSVSLIDEGAVSSTELVYGLLRKSRAKIPKKAALCIAAGIISDSAHFLAADKSTFRTMADVLEIAHTPYAEVIALFSLDADPSEKVAKLKAARRCRIYGSGSCVIATTDVGAFEASASAALVKLGADIAFAGDARKGAVKISARANNLIVRETGLDLARDVFEKLAKEFPGSGGGHPAAAAFNGSADDVKPLLARCAGLTHEFLKKAGFSKNPMKEYD